MPVVTKYGQVHPMVKKLKRRIRLHRKTLSALKRQAQCYGRDYQQSRDAILRWLQRDLERLNILKENH